MWKLVIADDEGQQTVVNLVREVYTIGRAEGHPIRLTERNISRNHARLQRTPHGYRLEDISSYNGLYINGVRVVGRQDLAHTDLIQLGDYRVQVVDENIDTQEQNYRLLSGEPAVPASGRLPHRLVQLIGPDQGAEFPLEGERFLLGRGAECEFTIDHASVSRVHAEVRTLSEGQFEIIDKGSANGLRVNGSELNRAILDSRDVVELGDVVLKYIPQGQVFRADEKEGTRIAAMAGAALPPQPVQKARSGLLPSLIAATLGAALVGGTAYSYFNEKKPEPPSTELHVAPELSVAAQLLSGGKLLACGEELQKLEASDKSLEGFSELEASWAEAALKSIPKDGEDDAHRKLLDLVSKTESLPPAVRATALSKLTALDDGAIDLSALEDGKTEDSTDTE